VTLLTQNGGFSLVAASDVAGEFADDITIKVIGKRIGAVVAVVHVQYPKMSITR
jgi:hypothetical protein